MRIPAGIVLAALVAASGFARSASPGPLVAFSDSQPALRATVQSSAANSPELQARVDGIFAAWTDATPGCAVAAARGGVTVIRHAYGMADLEQNTPIAPTTVFEAGSIAKQFTAAAVLLLTRDGKLRLDDPIQSYLPEVRAFQRSITIRHLLNHTSGMRDWGNVVSLSHPRRSKVYTNAHVLDIAARQRALNFVPGAEWSYSNTGYDLAAIIVERVSGMSLPEFTAARIFRPLGMVHTSWRDDFTRIVRGRATAYFSAADGFHTQMPFENTIGAAALLTTVDDLLRWNENFWNPVVGDPAFVREQERPGVLNDGRTHDYALGLRIGRDNGTTEVAHAGITAGYRADLLRYPAEHVSVAVLCNVDNAEMTTYSRAVGDLLLHGMQSQLSSVPAYHLSKDEREALVGVYAHEHSGVPVTVIADGEGLRLASGPMLVAHSATTFTTRNEHRTSAIAKEWTFSDQGARSVGEFGHIDVYKRVMPKSMAPSQLRALEGTYISAEAEAMFTVAAKGATLTLRRRPDTTITLQHVYGDVFEGPQIGTITFRRNSSHQPVSFTVTQDRMWNIVFAKNSEPR